MVVVVIQTVDGEKYPQFWTPVMLKYQDRPEVMKFVYDKDPSQYRRVFVTPSYLIPTYKTLIDLENGKDLTPETASMYNAKEYLRLPK